jgi:hypothetical protein
MVENYNLIELLNEFTPVDDILNDIINEISQKDIINGVRIA